MLALRALRKIDVSIWAASSIVQKQLPRISDRSCEDMSIDKSLKRKSALARSRSVLTRAERITTLKEQEKWTEGRSPFGLPKVRVLKVVLKKAKKEKVAEEDEPAKKK